MKFLTRSIRGRILMLVTGLLLVVFAVMTQRTVERRAADLHAALERVEGHARFIAAREHDSIHFATQYLRVLVETGTALALAHDPMCSERLARLRVETPDFVNIVITDASGLVTCNAVRPSPPVTLAERSFFARALMSSEAVTGDAVVGRSTGVWGLPIARSFRVANSSGNVDGVVGIMLDLAWVGDEFAALGYPADARLGLIDSNGVVLSRVPDPDNSVGLSMRASPFFQDLLLHHGAGTTESVGFDGVRRVYALAHFAETPSGPIYLWIGLSKAAVFEKANDQFLIGTLVAIIMMVASFIAAWYGGERLLVRPIQAIAGAARKLSRGNHLARTGVPHTSDEIGQLARVFDEMAQSLVSKSELLRLNRALRMISECNRAVGRADDEVALLHDVCQIAVDIGGYRMAWVGMAERDPERSVRPVAFAGHEDGYLQHVSITWADTERGRGPVGAAIRTGQPQTNHEFDVADDLAPWRDEAMLRGYKAASAFPLRTRDGVIGVLTLYTERTDPLHQDEIRLLDELADDLAYGLMSLRAQIATGSIAKKKTADSGDPT